MRLPKAETRLSLILSGTVGKVNVSVTKLMESFTLLILALI